MHAVYPLNIFKRLTYLRPVGRVLADWVGGVSSKIHEVDALEVGKLRKCLDIHYVLNLVAPEVKTGQLDAGGQRFEIGDQVEAKVGIVEVGEGLKA